MIQRVLFAIAGVDRKTLESCPATDKLWAAHLGFALCLSFIVVFGISLNATGYIIPEISMRVAASLVIALTVFMFDRALYQSDWFYQGFLWQSGGSVDGEPGRAQSGRRFLRIAIRLAMSFGLAWVIAIFLELAIFSDTITDKVKRDHVAINQPIYQKIEQFEAGLNSEIAQRRKSLAALETLYRDELASAPTSEATQPAQFGDFEQQIKALDAQEVELRNELRQIQEQIKIYAADMNAEQLGQRLNAANSGRAGAGPRYQFAKQQKEVYEQQRAALESEIAQLHQKREDLRSTQMRLAADAAARREQARAAIQNKRDALEAQVNTARNDLKELETSRLARVEDFRQRSLAASDFQKQKDDPLSRMTAYQALKSDPKDGQTITLFSWMTKFLIIFLEIVPIVAKLFFSPPSVYAAKIQAEVERERRRIQRERELDHATEGEIEEQMREIAESLRETSLRADADVAEFPKIGQLRTNQREGAPDEPERGPSLVPPAHDTKVKPKGDRADDESAPAVEKDTEAARRREMEELIGGGRSKHAGVRQPDGRRPAVSARSERQPNDLSSLGFLLQDDIPQKP